ncbi:MAG: hydroxyacylglutathione hydrolase [Methylococcales bacterium]|nr:hydroxyacylglutathione hydrolase [Methylococcales bacterium]
MLIIEQLPVLADNYVYLLQDSATSQTAVVDPAIAKPVQDALAARGWTLHYILNTHHHGDHVGANLALQQATGCQIVGFADDRARIPGLTLPVNDGASIALGDTVFEVIATPGHTLGHCCYYCPEHQALFCGDTLFVMGCGRVFEGTPGQLWQSLCKLRQLPESTRVFCAHEYTLNNARFALSLTPASTALQQRLQHIQQRRSQRHSTVPSTLAEERQFNPFMNADDPAWRTRLNMPGADDMAIFTRLRALKDTF